jgi:hypothetical protein
VIGKDLESAYREMAQEEEPEAEALEWAEATVGDVSDEILEAVSKPAFCLISPGSPEVLKPLLANKSRGRRRTAD